jgi:hypothetical protein
MRKIALLLPILFLLLVSNVFALKMITTGSTTIITGTVYEHRILPGNEVPFAHVHVFCGEGSAQLTANGKGDFAVGFDRSVCQPGSTIEVHAHSPDESLFGELITSCTKGSKCKDIVMDVTNASPVLLSSEGEHEIPEFSPVMAGLALLGAGIGFMFLRRD